MNSEFPSVQWRKSQLSGMEGGNCVEVATLSPAHGSDEAALTAMPAAHSASAAGAHAES